MPTCSLRKCSLSGRMLVPTSDRLEEGGGRGRDCVGIIMTRLNQFTCMNMRAHTHTNRVRAWPDSLPIKESGHTH